LNKKKIFSPATLWWLDVNILNINILKFKYSLINNIYFLYIANKYIYTYFLLNKKNLNTLNFYILDILTFKNINTYNYFIAHQSIFFDFKILIETHFKNKTTSISKINSGSLWIERETKEFNLIQYDNLLDTRKLLSNYNYNSDLQYNNYNNIINDLKI
jgi:hypothetical protein